MKYQDPECKFEWSIWKSDVDLLMEANPEIIQDNDYSPAYHPMNYSPVFNSKNSHKRLIIKTNNLSE